jgi:hypothetical protein
MQGDFKSTLPQIRLFSECIFLEPNAVVVEPDDGAAGEPAARRGSKDDGTVERSG